MSGSDVSFAAVPSRLRDLTVWRVDISWSGANPSAAFPASILGGIGGGLAGGGVGGAYLFKVRTIPGTGGAQPSANYGVTLTDSDGMDLLQGAGTGLSNTTAQDTVPQQDSSQALYGPVWIDPSAAPTFNCSNTASGATGTARFYFTASG